ncbi:MAG: hypothetical protein GY703_07470 [Gammaproteobacteria bacterium]|nr:hypothetical protein [Gammaproteobacteria bacterium]
MNSDRGYLLTPYGGSLWGGVSSYDRGYNFKRDLPKVLEGLVDSPAGLTWNSGMKPESVVEDP